MKNTDIEYIIMGFFDPEAQAELSIEKTGVDIKKETVYMEYVKTSGVPLIQRIVELENALNQYTINEDSKEKLNELSIELNKKGTDFLEQLPETVTFEESNHHLAVVAQYLVESTKQLPAVTKDTKGESIRESIELLEKAKISLKEWARLSLAEEEEYYILLGDEKQLAQWQAETEAIKK